jgi:hypothetical protein
LAEGQGQQTDNANKEAKYFGNLKLNEVTSNPGF